jgi:hypothetical protein
VGALGALGSVRRSRCPSWAGWISAGSSSPSTIAGTTTGEVKRGQIAPAGRGHVRAWLARFAGRGEVAFAVEGCAGWRYVAGELAAAGIAAPLGEPADTAALRGRKRHAKTDKTDARHLRTLLAEGRLPGCWIPRPVHSPRPRLLRRRR